MSVVCAQTSHAWGLPSAVLASPSFPRSPCWEQGSEQLRQYLLWAGWPLHVLVELVK